MKKLVGFLFLWLSLSFISCSGVGPEEPKLCTVSFSAGEDIDIAPVNLTEGSLLTRPEDPSRLEHSFQGWFKDSDFSEPWLFENDRVHSNMTLYGKWKWETFVSKWSFDTGNTTLVLPLDPTGTYAFSVDWGDGGSIEEFNSFQAQHSYEAPGIYEVRINGTCRGFGFSSEISASRLNLIDVSNWGGVVFHNEGELFANCYNIQGFSAQDSPDLSTITNLAFCFAGAREFVGGVAHWDTSNIMNMESMFRGAPFFNDNISSWNTSRVEDMSNMFTGADLFNQDLYWDTGNVVDMDWLFGDAIRFNGDISDWNTSSVRTMSHTFHGASAFNGDISRWNTSSVENMSYLFLGAKKFNADISDWDTSKVVDMSLMFVLNYAFNQDISRWNTSNVTSMSAMFGDATAFNQDLSQWDTSKVIYMSRMFYGAQAYNNGGNPQGLETWNISSDPPVDMDRMFLGSAIEEGNSYPSWFELP